MNLLNIFHRTIQSCYLQQTLVLHYLRANIFYQTHSSIYNRIYIGNVVESSCYKLGIYPLSYNFILGSFTMDEISFKLRKIRALVVQKHVARRSAKKHSNTKTTEKGCEKHIVGNMFEKWYYHFYYWQSNAMKEPIIHINMWFGYTSLNMCDDIHRKYTKLYIHMYNH